MNKQLDFNNNIDLIDQCSRYMDLLVNNEEGKTYFDQWAMWIGQNLNIILSNYVIPNGKIIQAGTWNGNVYFELQKIFKKERCIGFDIEKYINDDSIIYGDFRKIHKQYPYTCALFYNGLGSWEYNKKSKSAGLEYAIKNLVPGGLYLDVIHGNKSILTDIPQLEFCQIYDDILLILRKKND